MTIRVKPYKKTGHFYYDLRFALPDKTLIRERKVVEGKTEKQTRQAGVDRQKTIEDEFRERGRPVAKLGPKLSDYEDDYIAGCVGKRLKPSTIALKESNFSKWLVPTLGQLKLSAITDAELAKLLKELTAIGAKAANNVLGTLSAVLQYAVKMKVISEMPCSIELFKVPKPRLGFWERDELDRLLQAAGDGHRVALLLGADAGLRTGEIVALEWPDIDWARHEITISRNEVKGILGTPKNGKPRTTPMTKRLEKALREYRHLRGPRVLYKADGTHVDRKELSAWLADCEAAAGLPVKGRLHKLRHTFCSLLALAGVPAKVIQELADHHSLTVTERYMWLASTSKADAIALLEVGNQRAA